MPLGAHINDFIKDILTISLKILTFLHFIQYMSHFKQKY